MSHTWRIAFDLAGWLVVAGIFIWFLWRCLKGSSEPVGLIIKWVVTVVLIAGGLFLMTGLPKSAAMLVCIVVFLPIGIMWAPSITLVMIKPLTDLYDGGNQELEPAPLYSIAEGKRKKGQFEEAIQDIRGQLELFPGDFVGMMLMATIQAEDLKDMASARATIEELLAQPKLTPQAIASALHALADWHLQLEQDPEAARVALERIVTSYPNTSISQIASQRIARLSTVDELIAARQRGSIELPQGRRCIGLDNAAEEAAPETDPAAIAAGYVRQLEQHPLDTDTREKLAMIYAEQFHRVELAVDQLEQLIAQPNESAKHIVRWLNLLATVYVQHGRDLSAAEQTLRRIIEKYPKAAAADMAVTRLASLRSEFKPAEENTVKKFGTYEHHLGLKKNSE